MKLLIAGGGTGGSVNPAIAVAEEIRKLKPRTDILFVGTKNGPEKEIVKAAGLDFDYIPSAKLRRYFSIKNFFDIFKFIGGLFKSYFIIRKFRPDVIFGTGSFVQVPLCWIGKLFKAKIVIHQQDSRIGLANKLVSFMANSITTAFEYTSKEFYSGAGFMTKKWTPRAEWVGNPVRASIAEKPKDFSDFFGLHSDLPVLLILGGATGAEQINKLTYEISPRLVKSFQVVHQTGKGKNSSNFRDSNYHVFELLPFPQYSYILQRAHIVVSRAGLSTITELSSLGKCSIIIPMPHSHQEDNAAMMQLLGAAITLFREQATSQNLERIISKLNFDPETQKLLKKNIQLINRPDAAKNIAEIIIRKNLMKENRPKIGIALSGSSGRAIAHIGVLEVLQENNIPIDIIVGCSSGAMVATTFCLGNMNVLKEWFYKMTLRQLLSIWSVSIVNGGLLHLDKADPVLKTFTQDKSFEDIKDRKLAFVATDLNTGELVVLDKGDLNKSFKAAGAVPGLFDPIIIDNRVLVDGGLVNIVPTDVAKKLGADIVIGVNIAATKFIYEKRLPIWKGYKFITKVLGLQFLRQIFSKLASRVFFQFDSQSDTLASNDVKSPNAFSVLSQALDLAVKASESESEQDLQADIMLEPRVKHFGKVEIKRIDIIYQEGRRATQQAIPEIKKLIENFQK